MAAKESANISEPRSGTIWKTWSADITAGSMWQQEQGHDSVYSETESSMQTAHRLVFGLRPRTEREYADTEANT
jgi:hypothetical protein